MIIIAIILGAPGGYKPLILIPGVTDMKDCEAAYSPSHAKNALEKRKAGTSGK
ncbi:hypothetical protein KUC_0366 [Vreelandella boliviensis LC1]|uniref:Uncharacterized protein n=1 Tax=Vreelandella boliviensis LC1 TaxID=1072583 RepID=A0A7U9GGI8_9GAMM|nr:hypothetical protein KUC_0366 [Halomonas boliviensis LC1]